MAKYETVLSGDFDEIRTGIEEGILSANVSASVEERSFFRSADSRCDITVFERYSAFGANRVSLAVTLFESGGKISVSAITSGGSKAVFMKMNTVGEENFLETFISILNNL